MNLRARLPLLGPALVAACLLPAAVALVPAAGCSSGSTPGHDAGADTGSGGMSDAASPDAGTPVGVLEHHGDGTRGGVYVDPAFTKAAVTRIEPLAGFSATVSGKVFSQLLFLERGVMGQDALFAVTEANDVSALDASTGAQLWQKNLGTPMPKSDAPTELGQMCGTIWPLGITSTPVIDLASRSLLVVAMTMNGATPTYQAFALSLDDGSTLWSVDLGATVTGLDSAVQMQRGALTVQGGELYVPFGAQAGGCGDPHGWVVSVALAAPHAAQGWHTASVGAGIWGPSGVAADGTSVFASSAANSTLGVSSRWADGMAEAIVRVAPGATFSGATADFFAPTNWFAYDIAQSQLGSAGVVLLDVPGATPGKLAFAIGKTSDAYLVDRDDLGGVGTGVAHYVSAAADWVEGAMAAYTTPAGGWVAFNAPGSFCPAGTDLTTMKIVPGSPPTLAPGWCAVQGGSGSPMVTVSVPAGTGKAAEDVVVWGLGANGYSAGRGTLRAFDGETGALLAESSPKMSDLEHWVSPIVAKGRIYVAGDKHVYAWDLGGSPATVDAGTPPPADGGAPPAQCLLSVTAEQIDPCAAFGLACQGNPQASPYGSCQLPNEGQPCLAAPGCSSPTSCVTQGTDTRCRRACTTNADCPSIFQACTPGGAGSYCARTTCDASSYYQACQAGGQGGTCVPVYRDDGTASGECVAAGTATGMGCSATRAGSLCAQGSFCLTTPSGATCASLCDYTAATFGGAAVGPACPADQSCIFLGTTVPFGVCAKTCAAPADCTAPLTCQTWNPYTSLSACLP